MTVWEEDGRMPRPQQENLMAAPPLQIKPQDLGLEETLVSDFTVGGGSGKHVAADWLQTLPSSQQGRLKPHCAGAKTPSD